MTVVQTELHTEIYFLEPIPRFVHNVVQHGLGPAVDDLKENWKEYAKTHQD